MKRKEYQKPTMEVVEMHQRYEMLVQSQFGMQNYGMNQVGDFKEDPSSSSLPNYLDTDWGQVVNPEALSAE